MLNQLVKIEKYYDELEAQIAKPEVAADPKQLEKLARERASLEDIVTKYRRYKEIVKSRSLLYYPKTPTTSGILLWRSGLVPAARRLGSLLPTSSVCTVAMPCLRAGRWIS
jgi:hypothetical protein